MKKITALCLLMLWAAAQAQAATITYDVVEDVTQYGDSGPTIEGYHLLVIIKDLEISNGNSTAVMRNKMFHWSFADHDEGLQAREALTKLKTLVGIENHDLIDQISEIVRELTNATKP